MESAELMKPSEIEGEDTSNHSVAPNTTLEAIEDDPLICRYIPVSTDEPYTLILPCVIPTDTITKTTLESLKDSSDPEKNRSSSGNSQCLLIVSDKNMNVEGEKNKSGDATIRSSLIFHESSGDSCESKCREIVLQKRGDGSYLYVSESSSGSESSAFKQTFHNSRDTDETIIDFQSSESHKKQLPFFPGKVFHSCQGCCNNRAINKVKFIDGVPLENNGSRQVTHSLTQSGDELVTKQRADSTNSIDSGCSHHLCSTHSCGALKVESTESGNAKSAQEGGGSDLGCHQICSFVKTLQQHQQQQQLTTTTPATGAVSNIVRIYSLPRSAEMSDFSSDQLICRICHSSGCDEDLISPCKCAGSSQYVHATCLITWFKKTVKKHCELCKSEVKIKKKNRKISVWRKPEDSPVPLIWFSVFFVGLFLNVLSIYVNASEYCKSTACLIFYVVNGFGILLDAAFLWFWFLKCMFYWRKWCALNQDWFIENRKTPSKASSKEIVQLQFVRGAEAV